jgi:hypothetical protein
VQRSEREPEYVAFGSFVTELSRQQVGPCPLCSDSDPILQPSEMARRAISGLMQRSKKGQLFDNLVGTSEQCWRNCQAERLRGLEVDDQLVLGRILYR